MTELEYEYVYTHVRDRSDWAAGPWDNEPMDKLQWTDPATQLPALMVRGPYGSWCGYVGVSEDHPLFGKGYSQSLCAEEGCYEHTPDDLISVHGGLTYAAACTPGPEDSSICHIPRPGQSDRVWWFGFDTAHAYDLMPNQRLHWHGDTYRDVNYVQAQVTSLAAQLAGLNVPRAGSLRKRRSIVLE